jgi:dTDP-4-dehydrorhamnose reductase
VVLKVLLTGGTGILGTQILSDQYNVSHIKIYHPLRKDLDITSINSVFSYFANNCFDMVLHCAAYTQTLTAEEEIKKCIETNIIGTWNLLKCSMEKKMRFVYISTDYVFDGRNGNYHPEDAINPIGRYSKSKAAAELMVRMYDNSLSIRTSFVPKEFPHNAAFIDQYTNRDYVDIISPLVLKAAISNKIGVAHVGTGKKSVFKMAQRRKKDVKAISINDVDFYLPSDVSLAKIENNI